MGPRRRDLRTAKVPHLGHIAKGTFQLIPRLAGIKAPGALLKSQEPASRQINTDWPLASAGPMDQEV